MDWRRILNLTKAEVVGLDIGSSMVKAVQVHKSDDGYEVSAAGVAEISTDEDSKHDQQAIGTIRAIRECFSSMDCNTEFAVCSVSGPEVAVREFQFPSLAKEEIEPAVLLEASQVCPFNAADIVTDYCLVSGSDDKTRGFLVAATNGLIKNRIRLAKEARFKCVLMDVDGLALLNCFNSLADESVKSKTAILNVGGSCTTVAIMGDNDWPFIRDMKFAGEDILRQIATEKGMSIESVREALFGDPTKTQKELNGCLKRACHRLIVDIKGTLRFYAAQEQSKSIDKVFVCGGFALANGFVELLDSSLGVEALLWNPFEKMLCDSCKQYGDIFGKKGPAMAVAAGLAMRSL